MIKFVYEFSGSGLFLAINIKIKRTKVTIRNCRDKISIP